MSGDKEDTFARLDNLLGRLRAKGLQWAVLFLLGLGLVYCSEMVIDSWRACSKAMNYVVLGKSTLPVARFLEARQGQDTVLAYWRSFEVRPAVTNPRAKVVAVDTRTHDDAASLMRAMYENGVSHLAIEERITDPLGKRVRLLGEVRDRLLAEPDGAWLAEDAGRIKIFRVPPPDYWSVDAGETTNVIPR